jgi:hypothetical protein
MRLNRLLCVAALSMAALNAGAQAVATPDLNPYIQVKTVEGDEYIVRAFFSPACSYSREYFPFFVNLSKTLPAGQTFAFTPLVNKGDGMGYAMSFLAVKRFYPQYVQNFVEASLKGTQDIGLSPRNWAAIDRMGQAAHIPVSVPRLVNDNKEVLHKDLDDLIRLQSGLKITNTPSVSVAGTYIVTPEFTMGDVGQFSALVNGVISMVTVR